MKLLILSQYFPPETGAPQNRLFELAARSKNFGIDVDVFTAMPNYPEMKVHKEYRGKWFCTEKMQGMIVHRSWIYATKSKSIIPRLLNYFSFVFSSLFFGLFKLKRYDYILVESPPLFLGISAYLLKFKCRSKLIFNVSDLWPESAEKLGLVKNKLMLGMASMLEEFMYKKSYFIVGQTQGIVKNISSRFPSKKVFWLPNGVDTSMYDPALSLEGFREKNGFSKEDIILFYGGIIGHAQGLELILKAAKKFEDQPKVRFVLLGEGPVKEDLISISQELENTNVYFLDGVPKSEILGIVSQIDATIIPLKKLDLFKGAIPSKIFECLAMEKPVLLGVEGEAYDLFIKEGDCGWFFEPENVEDLCKVINYMIFNVNLIKEKGKNGRKYVSEKFERDRLAEKFVNFLKNE